MLSCRKHRELYDLTRGKGQLKRTKEAFKEKMTFATDLEG